MGGNLEDKILKRNVPGCYSQHRDADQTDRDRAHRHHDSDNEDEGSEHDDDDDDGSGDGVDESNSRDASIARMSHMHGEGVPESVYRSIEAKRLAGPQTGVKGVLADYRQSQALDVARRQQEALHREQVLYRMATGHGPPGSTIQPTTSLNLPPTTQNASDDSDDDDLLEDDTFMQQFRQQRLAEMTATAGNTSSSSGVVDNTNKPLPYFGEVIDIDEFDPHEVLQGKTGEPAARLSSRHDFFLHHLSNTDSRVTTVVHTYEPDIKLCAIVNEHLNKIAALFPRVKFIKMMASANGIAIDPVAMPVLSIYREGVCVEVLTDIAEEVVRDDGLSGGERLARSDVEMVLSKFLQ